jgi:hypothetical protein
MMSTVKTINVQHPSSASANLVLDSSGNATIANDASIEGDLKFDSGYGSAATSYGCRAWVNFAGNANTNLSGTYSQSGTTVTVTATSHGQLVGSEVYADITSGTGVDGTYTVATVPNSNTFTYTAGTSLTTSGNVTIRRNTIRASGNVANIADNGAGDYTVNFLNPMPDANYAVHVTGSSASGAAFNYSFGVTDAGAYSTVAVRINVERSDGVATDMPRMSVTVYR